MVLVCQTAILLGRRRADKVHQMNSMPNPEQTDPDAVAVAVLKQAYQLILSADEEPDAERRPSDQQKRLAVARRRSSRGRLALHGLIGLLMAACIGAAAIALSHDDAAQSSPSAVQASAAKAAPSQPAPPALGSSALTAAGPSPEQAQLLQSIAREHAAVELEIEQLKTSIEQLKTSDEQMVRNNAAVAEQLKASQEQMARDNAAAAEQLKASQEQMARDNAAAAEQLKASQEQMARLIAKASGQKPRPKTSALPPSPIATPTGKPVPKLSPPQARARRLAPMQGRSEQQ
jgi:hypothetical protein